MLSGEARARVVASVAVERNVRSLRRRAVPPGWVNTTAGGPVTTLDGQKVLQKAPDDTIFKRVRTFIGPANWSNYTFEADVRVDDAAAADGATSASRRSATRSCSTATRSG